MKKTLLTIIAALLLGGVVNAQNHWDAPDSHAKSSNTPIVASVTIDGQPVTLTADYRLGAFVGDELRGLAAPYTEEEGNFEDSNFWIQVFYNQGTSEDITFKLWNPTGEGTELTDYTLTNGALTALTTSEEGYGTPSNPVVLDFATTQTQSTTLAAGWTWWSTPVELSGMSNALQQLEACISQYGMKIQSQSNGTRTKRGTNWVGPNFTLVNEKCYKIQVSDASMVSMTGTMANPADHPITLNQGWNWIGYPVNSPQSVGIALANLEPESGDVIMGQGGTSTFRAGQWRNPITLTPGYGYLYNSKSSDPKTFVYSVSRTENSPIVQEEPFWNTNIHKYENCMAIIAVVYVGEDELFDDSIELGAFVDGTCTGSSKMFYLEEENRYYVILTAGGNDGDRVSFAMVNEAKDLIYNESDNNLTFSSNAIIGDFDQPYEIHFGSMGIGESTMRVAMYPNPVDRGQAFKLNIPQEEEVLDLTIVNAMGTVIRHETGAFKSTITGIPVAGVYTIKVYCQSGNTYYGRLIVK